MKTARIGSNFGLIFQNQTKPHTYILGLILLLVPVILANSDVSPCKIKNLDYVLVILDSSTFGPLFNHVSRICIIPYTTVHHPKQ